MRQALRKIGRVNNLDVEAGERRACSLGRMADDHEHRASLRGKRRLGDVADERFAVELGSDLGLFPKSRRAAGGENNRSARSGFRRRAAMISARMETAISAGLAAPMSRPIGA